TANGHDGKRAIFFAHQDLLSHDPQSTSSAPLELESHHELNLTWQTGAGIGRSRVIVVEVEVVGRSDDSERTRYIQMGRSIRGIVNQSQIPRIAKLDVIEDVERLHGEFYRYVLADTSLLGEGHIDLPGVESA